jgi:hypothetical protein
MTAAPITSAERSHQPPQPHPKRQEGCLVAQAAISTNAAYFVTRLKNEMNRQVTIANARDSVSGTYLANS